MNLGRRYRAALCKGSKAKPALRARRPARLATASRLLGGSRGGFGHRVLAFPDVHFARSAGTLRQPEVELNPKIKAHA
jgi:hypothetical protein